MAGLAFGGGYGVIGGFCGAVTYAVMAARIVATKVDYLRIVVIKDCDDPISSIVAFTAIQRCGQVIGAFACGNYAVMATLTSS